MSVYSEVRGDHKHQFRGVNIWIRKNGHNVVISMERKNLQWDNSLSSGLLVKSLFDKDIMEKAINPLTQRHNEPNAKTLLERIYKETDCTTTYWSKWCGVLVTSDVGGGETLTTPNNQRYSYISKVWRTHYGRPTVYTIVVSVGPHRRFISMLVFF